MPDRRTILAAGSAFAAALALPRGGHAQQAFASLRMFIPAGPGGGWDGLGRAIEQVLRQAGKVGSFQFENVGGAGGAPAINAGQRDALVKLMRDMHALPAWKELLATRGWEDAFLVGEPFVQFIAEDTAATEVVLKELGLA